MCSLTHQLTLKRYKGHTAERLRAKLGLIRVPNQSWLNYYGIKCTFYHSYHPLHFESIEGK